MHARVTHIQGQADRVDQAIRQYREQIVPEVQQQQGLTGLYLFVDRQAGKALSLSLWESEAAMQQSEPVAQQQRERGAQEEGATPFTAERYEVAFTEGALSGPFARVTTSAGVTADMETGQRYVREQVLPGMQGSEGFTGMLHLIDRQGNKMCGVVFWDSEAALRRSADTAQQLREGADRAGLGGTRSAADYEVVVQV